MAALTVVPKQPLSLAAIEEQLNALENTADLVAPEKEQEFQREFSAALVAAQEKRDRIQRFLVHCEAQAAQAAAEMRRLSERKSHYEKLVERVEGYVVRAIESLGTDERGQLKRLEGATVTFAAKACPPSVKITDEDAVPVEYKAASISVPLAQWEAMLDALPFEMAIEAAAIKPGVSISKTSLKAALQVGPVAGCTLDTSKKYLVRK